MSLQVECSAEEGVTIRASKILKDCISVAHITYVIIVPQQSDRYVVFLILRLASSPIVLPSAISISYSTMLRVSRSSTKGISFIWTRWNWSALNPSIFLTNKLNNFEVCSSSHWFPCMWRTKPKRETVCRYMVVSCSLQTWDSWLCDF